MFFLRAIITYLPKIQPEARGSKIGMIKINSYKSNVFLKSNYHIFTIMISSDNPSYALIRASLSVTTWSDQSGKIGVPTFSWWIEYLDLCLTKGECLAILAECWCYGQGAKEMIRWKKGECANMYHSISLMDGLENVMIGVFVSLHDKIRDSTNVGAIRQPGVCTGITPTLQVHRYH